MIFLTWAAGMIGSVILAHLNAQDITDVVAIDHLTESQKWRNLVGKKFSNYLDRDEFLKLYSTLIKWGDIVIHMGACSATTEKDTNYLMYNNTKYSHSLFRHCQMVWARLIYASSAATYWNGEKGYSDREAELTPINMYGYSKHLFDQWIRAETVNFKTVCAQVVGLKFFNVYGPNEYHKGAMSSVIYHGYRNIEQTGYMQLFRSDRPGILDGGQQRDFIYVRDIARLVDFFLLHPEASGIYNAGSWEARTFYDLARATCDALWKTEQNIEFIDMPAHLKGKYQYYTRADISPLRALGYTHAFTSLETGVQEYITQYLTTDSYL